MADKNLAHNVFFSLVDNSLLAKVALVEGCKKYLSGHPGTVYFSCGLLAEELHREVNDRGFDVALHIVFENQMAHDAYQEAPRHDEFIRNFESNWKKVRVFDSLVSG